jgi:hypothetical protein
MAHIHAGGRKPPAWGDSTPADAKDNPSAGKTLRWHALIVLVWLSVSAFGQSSLSSAENHAAQPSVCAAPRSLDFGKIGLHLPSAPAFVTITNCGKTDVAVSKISIANSKQFADINGCPLEPARLAQGTTCTVRVFFSPDVEGSSRDDLLVSTQKGEVTVHLSGVGVASTTTLSSTYIVFGTQLWGTRSKPGFVTIRNASPERALRMDSLRLEGQFVLLPGLVSCHIPGELAPSMTCNLAVSFAPQELGSLDGKLIVTDSDPASPHVIGIHGTATGLEISPTHLRWQRSFVGATSEPQEFRIKAVGEQALQIESIDTAGDFEQHNSCGKQLQAGATCTVTVAFRPSESGKRMGRVSITDSDPSKVQYVSLVGEGVATGFFPSTLVFEGQKTGTTSLPQTVTLKNYGSKSLTISSIDVGGAFAVPARTCGESLPPGQSCTISVTFLPTHSGTAAGYLQIHESGDSTPLKVILTGTGT